MYVCSPVDMMIDPAFYPAVLQRTVIAGYNVELVSHTEGLFNSCRLRRVRWLCDDFRHLAKGLTT